MPSFGQERDREAGWASFPGLDRLEPVAGAPRCVLTFDDGPDPDGTPAVLAALEATGARATFFVVGEQLMRHHALAREAFARGHELALHGFSHERHELLSPAQSRDEVARSIGAFEAATSTHPRFFRPPYGRFNEWSFAACQDLGLTPVYWSAWGLDWETLAPGRIAELVGRDLADGTIALLHDSARYAPTPSVGATAEALEPLARLADERGLRLETLGTAVGESRAD